jgi:hypothetical protein
MPPSSSGRLNLSIGKEPGRDRYEIRCLPTPSLGLPTARLGFDLAKWGLNYVIDEYLPRKLANESGFLP